MQVIDAGISIPAPCKAARCAKHRTGDGSDYCPLSLCSRKAGRLLWECLMQVQRSGVRLAIDVYLCMDILCMFSLLMCVGWYIYRLFRCGGLDDKDIDRREAIL